MPTLQTKLLPRHQLSEDGNMVSASERKSESSVERKEHAKPAKSNFSLERSKVRFSQKLEEYHYILSRQAFSERELRHCWYMEEEKEKYMDRHERSAKRLENGERSKRGESFRGLEGWTQDGGDEANEMIAECVDAVLQEQERQWKKERLNPGNLALISESKSKKCVKIALKTGQRDMKEAIRAYESMGLDDLDLDSASASIASYVKPTTSSTDSDESELYRPRPKGKSEEQRKRSSSQRRSSAYRSRGDERRGKKSSSSRGDSTSQGAAERKRRTVPLE